MATDRDPRTIAQEGLQLIEQAIIRLLEANPQGLGNVQIADLLGLNSDFRGSQRDYLTYSVLGGLLAKGKIIRNDKTKLFVYAVTNDEDIDIAAIGRAMYEEIRGELEKTHKGKVVVIDVKSGDYEIGDDDLETTLRMFERRPSALTWGERVGYSAMYTFGERIQFIEP